jgi:uncharacterized protein (TIGR00255 family)
MTGYANCSQTLPGATLTLELRSVNSRFLDIHFRLPDELRPGEPALREAINSALERGKVDCRAAVTADSAGRRTAMNSEALAGLKAVLADIGREFPDAGAIAAGDILRWPGLFGDGGPDLAACNAAMKDLVATCLVELQACREREGAQLAAALRSRLAAMRTIIADIAPLIPAAQAAFEARVRQRLVDALGSADEERIRQEVVVYATRVDVAEEVSRLNAHIGETERVLAKGGAAGKRLDFLMQEFNREANTLGSKSVSGEVSAAAMELKILIEQMREQVQNIE